jgi:hypothetical protein
MKLSALRLCRRTVRKGCAFPAGIIHFEAAPQLGGVVSLFVLLNGKAEPYRTVRPQSRNPSPH